MVLKQQVMLILFWVNLWLSDHWVHYINSYMAAASTRVNRSHISLSTVGQAPCEGFSTNWHKLSHRLMIDHWNSVFICVPTISRCSSCHHPVLLICNVFVCLDVTCLHFVHQWNFCFISSWWIPMRCKHKPPFISNWRNSMPHFIEYNFFLLYKNN